MPTPRTSAGRFNALHVPSQLSARWSLGQRLALLVGLMLMVIVLAFGAIAYDEVRDAAVARSVGRIEGVARELVAAVQRGAGTRVPALARAGNAPAVQQALLAGGATELGVDRIRSALDSVLRPVAVPGRPPVPDTAMLAQAVVRADGAIRFRSATLPARDSAMLLTAVAEAMARDTVVRSPLFVVDGTVHIWTVVPAARIGPAGVAGVRQRTTSELQGAGRTPAGAVAELRRVVGSAQTEGTLQRLTGEDVRVLLTSQGGAEWAALNGVPIDAPFTLPEYDTLATRVDHAGGAQYAVQARIPGTPWLIVVTQPESSILSRPHDFLRRLTVAGLVLLALGIIGVWWLTRRETRPLDALRDATLDVAQGQYARRVPLKGGAEIASLAYMFNAMASRIGDATAVLERQNVSLAEANDAKARFLAVMSHELRTPLNAIGGYVDLIRYGVYGPTTPEQMESLERVRRSKDQLLNIVSDILQYSRLDAGQLSLRRETVSVAMQFTAVLESLAQQAASQGVTLRVVPTSAMVCADAARLQQVLLNLVTNAIRFTGAEGTVTLSTEARGSWTAIVVRDTGVGIPSDQLEGIFEPFRQVDSSLTRKVGGTGLGLSIVRDLTTGMGGTVRAESAVGEGSVFTVTLETAIGATATATNPDATELDATSLTAV